MYFFLVTEFTKILCKAPIYIPGKGFIVSRQPSDNDPNYSDPNYSDSENDTNYNNSESENEDESSLETLYTGEQIYRYSPDIIKSFLSNNYYPDTNQSFSSTFDIGAIKTNEIDTENIPYDSDEEEEYDEYYNIHKDTSSISSFNHYHMVYFQYRFHSF